RHPRQPGDLPRPAPLVRGHALSLAGGRGGDAARLPRDQRAHLRRGAHGRAAPPVPDRRHPVPPGVGGHAGRQAPADQFPSHEGPPAATGAGRGRFPGGGPVRSASAMKAAFYLLTLVGLIGSYDVLYWHWYRLRLFSLPAARW